MTRLTLFVTAIALAAAVIACNDVTTPPTILPGLLMLTAPDTAPADGKTLVVVVATVDTAVHGDRLVVKFHTTAGAFGGQSDIMVTADLSQTATALLTVATDSTQGLISASIGTSNIVRLIRFTRALPEHITVVPAQLSLNAGSSHELSVTATLRRSVGTPTPGGVVTFTAIDTLGKPLGWFANPAPSGVTGAVTTTYTSGETSYKGLLRIIGVANGIRGQISDTALVQIIP